MKDDYLASLQDGILMRKKEKKMVVGFAIARKNA